MIENHTGMAFQILDVMVPPAFAIADHRMNLLIRHGKV
jgi:hypothetical protein